MSPGAIWRKTLIFSWINLGLGLLTLLLCLVIGGGAYFIITNFAFEMFTNIAIGCGAFLCVVVIYFVVMSRFGYGIKLGQLAIVERAQRGEPIPANPVGFSKSIVSERFGNSRKYYAMSRDISTALRQILRVISRGFTLESETPQIGSGRWLSLLIAHPAISCIDECCLTYALRKHDYEVNAASIDALTILVQNWRAFIRRALRLSIIVYVICLILMALFFLPGFAICRQFVWNSLPWLGISFFLVLTFKIAFIDSYTLTKIVCEFLDLSQKSTIDPENYKKLDAWSKVYLKLRKSAEKAAEKAEDEAERVARENRKAARAAEKAETAETAENAVPAENAEPAEIAETADSSETSEVADASVESAESTSSTDAENVDDSAPKDA